MPLWDQSVAVLRESIFAYAQLCHGNLGAGILVVTFLARLALLPLGIRVARAAQAKQAAMQRIQSELVAVRARYQGDARRVAEETQRLLRREGLSMAPAGLLGSIGQIPVFIALYSAVRQVASAGGRFLWVVDVARPSVLVAIVVTALTMGATMTGTSSSLSNQTVMLVVSGLVTAVVLSKMAAGIGLYWGMSTLFSIAQGLAVRRGAAARA